MPVQMPSITLIDAEGLDADPKNTILWRRRVDECENQFLSIFDFLDDDPEKFRSDYLHLILDLTQTKLRSGFLIEKFKLNEKFNLWWGSAFIEKCNFDKSPGVDEVVKLLAFKKVVETRGVSEVSLITDDYRLVEALDSLCQNLDISFKHLNSSYVESINERFSQFLIRSTIFFKALVWFFLYVFKHYPLWNVGYSKWKSSDAKILFINYMDQNLSNDGTYAEFDSNYWSGIPSLVTKLGLKSNWIHIYSSGPGNETVMQAGKRINTYNKAVNRLESHVSLETFLSVAIIFKALSLWIYSIWKIFGTESQLKKKKEAFSFFWSFYRHDWAQTAYGHRSLSNIVTHLMFERALSAVNKQELGFYLQENQPWEFGLCQSWANYQHGSLVGYSHSNVRFWDLRYFFATEHFFPGEYKMPFPNIVAVNGPMASKQLENFIPKNVSLMGVEATRYWHLNRVKNKKHGGKNGLRVLLVGDYLEQLNLWHISVLKTAFERVDRKLDVTFKAHPNTKISKIELEKIGASETHLSVDSIFEKIDIVVCGSTSSVAVEAFCQNIPLVCLLDPRRLNLSPLFDSNDTLFTSSPDQVTAFIENVSPTEPRFLRTDNVFYFSENMKGWRNLFELGLKK